MVWKPLAGMGNEALRKTGRPMTCLLQGRRPLSGLRHPHKGWLPEKIRTVGRHRKERRKRVYAEIPGEVGIEGLEKKVRRLLPGL
jgi:hypothetical protein